MLNFTTGNLLEARAHALVNTVNTVGVMGKGIALMFKERFDDNYRQYAAACKAHEVRTGQMFITQPAELDGPQGLGTPFWGTAAMRQRGPRAGREGVAVYSSVPARGRAESPDREAAAWRSPVPGRRQCCRSGT